MSDKRVVPIQVPDAEKVNGMYFNPETEMVQLQYISAGATHEIRFPLAEILKAEDWFIQLRQSLGPTLREQRDGLPDKLTR